jgi:hypothetical protein
LRQVRRSYDASPAGNLTSGLIFFSMATSNIAVANNPFALPAPANTPARPFAEFASALTTGRSVSGLTLYEPIGPRPVFDVPAFVPDMPWKTTPVAGHLMGIVKDETGAVVDTGAITIARQETTDAPPATRTTVNGATDGNGFYGGVDLAPGTYKVTVVPDGQPAYTTACTVDVTAGRVSSFDVAIDREAPTVVLDADPSQLWPPNHQMVDVTLRVAAEDGGTGVATVAVRVVDEYGRVQPEVATVDGGGEHRVDVTHTVALEAARDGRDKDGRTYVIEVTVTDRACNSRSAQFDVRVAHDQRR